MRYIRHKSQDSRGEFRDAIFDEGIPSVDRIEVLRKMAQIDRGERSPASFGEEAAPGLYVWSSEMFETSQGRRGIWLSYEPPGDGATILRAFATYTGGPRESEVAVLVSRDRQQNGTRT